VRILVPVEYAAEAEEVLRDVVETAEEEEEEEEEER
jgi:hypothetical protein